MLTSRQFNARLSTLRANEETLKQTLAELLGFALFHAIAHGNKAPLHELQKSAPYGWVADQLAKVSPGRRDKSISEKSAQMRADMLVADMFAGQSEKRAIAKANREARAERKAANAEANAKIDANLRKAREADVIDLTPSAVEMTDGLIVHGELVAVTEDEAAMLAEYLTMLRMERPQLKVA